MTKETVVIKMNDKIKRGKMYYLVLHKRDWTYQPAVIVPVKVVGRPKGESKFSKWFVVEQQIEGFKHRLTVHGEWLAPYSISRAKELLHNMKQWENRWCANGWRHRLSWKTAKIEVLKAIAALPKSKQKKLWAEFEKTYPELLKPDKSLRVSKMKMKHWDEIAWATIALKYPLKQV